MVARENLEKARAALTMIQPEPFNAEALHRGRHRALAGGRGQSAGLPDRNPIKRRHTLLFDCPAVLECRQHPDSLVPLRQHPGPLAVSAFAGCYGSRVLSVP